LLPENTPLLAIVALKKGENVYDDKGKVLYGFEEYTWPAKKSRSYAYMSDTAYSENYLERIKGVDLLYHESTFLKELQERADATYHTTAADAAEFAKKAGVTRLLLGHFSSRYRELDPLLDEARAIFPQSYLAIEGHTFSVFDE